MKSRCARFTLCLIVSSAFTTTACSEDDDVVEPVTRSAACLENGGSEPVSASANHAGQEIDLFAPVAEPDLTEEQEVRLTDFQEQEYAIEVHVTSLVEDAFSLVTPGQAFGVRLSTSARVVGVAENVTEEPPLEDGESFVVSWSGPLTDRMGDITMSISEDGSALGGLVVYPTADRETAMYEILPLGGGLHATVCTDWTQFEGENEL